MSDPNLETYRSADIVNWYQGLNSLVPAEEKTFVSFAESMLSGSVLDLGIGGGRTTAWLADKCKNYTGIDYSEPFVEACKKRFSNMNILWMDARELQFDSGSFDLVNFSFNGIDYVNKIDREKILKETHRVLKKGGTFFFSTHNMLHPTFDQWPWKREKESFIYNLKTFIRTAPFAYRKFLNKSSRFICKDHALINDHAHDFRLITYYSTPQHIREQLMHVGFHDIQLLDKEGRPKSDHQLDDWIFVTCQK